MSCELCGQPVDYPKDSYCLNCLRELMRAVDGPLWKSLETHQEERKPMKRSWLTPLALTVAFTALCATVIYYAATYYMSRLTKTEGPTFQDVYSDEHAVAPHAAVAAPTYTLQDVQLAGTVGYLCGMLKASPSTIHDQNYQQLRCAQFEASR